MNEHHYDGRWWLCNHHKDGYHTLNLRVQQGVGVQVTEKNSFAIEIDYCLYEERNQVEPLLPNDQTKW